MEATLYYLRFVTIFNSAPATGIASSQRLTRRGPRRLGLQALPEHFDGALWVAGLGEEKA